VSLELSPALLARISNSLQGAVDAQPLSQADLSGVSRRCPAEIAARFLTGFGVTTLVAGEQSGYAVLHRPEGARFGLHLAGRPERRRARGFRRSLAVLARLLASCIAVLAGGAAYALRRYFRERPVSVDSRYKAITIKRTMPSSFRRMPTTPHRVASACLTPISLFFFLG